MAMYVEYRKLFYTIQKITRTYVDSVHYLRQIRQTNCLEYIYFHLRHILARFFLRATSSAVWTRSPDSTDFGIKGSK